MDGGSVSRSKPVAINGDLDLIAGGLVEHDSEVDLHLLVFSGGADQRAGFVDLVQAERAGTGDVDQNAAAPRNAAGVEAAGKLMAFRAAITAAFSPAAVAVPIMA